MRFPTGPAPHLAPQNSITTMMLRVLLALVPALLVWVWFFGWGIVFNIVIASATALLAEVMMLYLRGKAIRAHLLDLSAIVTAVLLAFCLPPTTPWWITVTGVAFAIIFAKHLYGGLGHNPFNPAMAGYVVLLISFPVEMTQWLPPRQLMEDGQFPTAWAQLVAILTGELPGASLDAISRATPLDVMRTELGQARTIAEITADPRFGDLGGYGWEWIGNGVLLGGIWLIYKKVIRWQIPVAVLAGVLIPATFFYLLDPGSHASPAFHLFSGATLLCAFFIATDPVSASTTRTGRLIYGAGIGFLIYAIRSWGGYPDAVAFAVLLMNMAVPLIDRYTKPRAYGHQK
ncbi:electron transport complex protein RnfD [Natronospira proteinivora]|uniref:Ion-translocating oxidoreductase complex subunit D n=1 Tax=Natronospira proteinivora TaxID=1807133 RepID=A0ABT1G716_9GAMM|nr:electron transport complex subunit RsxD [Natronospira proteinivora]MCP1726153.1 electron transport complex protein RnfD [Natronospira proteinivora]